MDIKVVPNSQTPIYKQVKNQIRDMIIRGQTDHLDFLPSERKLASETGVHRNTIIKAYHELMDDGLIAASQGKGYKILYQKAQEEDEPHKKKGQGIAWEFLVRDEFKFTTNTFNRLVAKSYDENLISFAGGILSPDSYCREDIRETLASILSSERDDIYKYAPYQGLAELRKNISVYLKDKGIYAKPSEIQIFSEANHAFEYLLRLFVASGDAVFVEEPASPEVYHTLRLFKAKVITIPLTEQGIDTKVVEKLIAVHRPKLIYTSASFSDPTGIVAEAKTRKKLLELAAEYKIPIIEEDASSELYFTEKEIHTTKSMDKYDNVIYIYSYALTFPPGFKLTYVIAPQQVVKRLSYLISVHIVSVDSLTQSLMSEFLKNGMYKKNLAILRALFQKKRDRMCEGLAQMEETGLQFRKPQGGVYLWCKLPHRTDPVKLLHSAREKGITFMPGNLFFLNGNEGSNFIRLNYSYPSFSQIERGMSYLSEALKESIEPR